MAQPVTRKQSDDYDSHISHHLLAMEDTQSPSNLLVTVPLAYSTQVQPASKEEADSALVNDRSSPSLLSQQRHRSQSQSSEKALRTFRPSALSSKSRFSSDVRTNPRSAASGIDAAVRPHVYFTSSEEESEAELDEKDSHSSVPSETSYSHYFGSSHHRQSQRSNSNISSSSVSSPSFSRRGNRGMGNKELTIIANKVSNAETSNYSNNTSKKVVNSSDRCSIILDIPVSNIGNYSLCLASDMKQSIHTSNSSSVQMKAHKMKDFSILNQKAFSNSSISETMSPHLGSSIILSQATIHRPLRTTPCLPHTVTVSIGNDCDTSNEKNIHTYSSTCNESTDMYNNQTRITSSAAPASSSIPSTPYFRRRQRCKHRHSPCGLPVFKDSGSFMWTSTHDANAPSEDRYSSLVNVLLRPPKSTRISADESSMSEKNNSMNDVFNSSDNDEVPKNNTNNKESRPGSTSNRTVFNGDDEQTTAVHPCKQKQQKNDDNSSLIRLSLWSVIDGHGGGCVATYAAEVLLPHIAASIARVLQSEIVDRGVCNVNGQLRDANALDLDGLIRSSDRSKNMEKSQLRQREAGIDVINPNSIHYHSPYEDSESEVDLGMDHNSGIMSVGERSIEGTSNLRTYSDPEAGASSLLPENPVIHTESVSSVKTSIGTTTFPLSAHAPVGTHSPNEVAAITKAITDSFLAVDEGWINSIDPITTHQNSCISNGRWNAGACALVVFIVQRLDWCRSSRVNYETHHRESETKWFEDTSHNKDAARRRKLDYAKKSKSVSSVSTMSSTSSTTTEANTTELFVEESEITETEEEDDDVAGGFLLRRRGWKKSFGINNPHNQEGVFIPSHAGCKCHYYRPHDAMLYTAHVGDCRAVMLGSAPPRTIKVPPEGDLSHSSDHADMSEDESSLSVGVADETGTSDHNSDSSEEDDCEDHILRGTMPINTEENAVSLGYLGRPLKRQRRGIDRSIIDQSCVSLSNGPESSSSEESVVESDDSTSTTTLEDQPLLCPMPNLVHVNIPFTQREEEKMLETEDEDIEDEIKEIRSVRSGSPTQMDRQPRLLQWVVDPPCLPPPLPLLMRPIDLTTDHSAYNPGEVTAVLRRCNNAPRAIASAAGGGIKRVAGSLAVTRALGDAYLKTPRLSFFPYKRHAPYITARPEVNCRILMKGDDRILILASDGVWERASGNDVLRWVKKYYNNFFATHESNYHQSYERNKVGEEYLYGVKDKRISRRKHASRYEEVCYLSGGTTNNRDKPYTRQDIISENEVPSIEHYSSNNSDDKYTKEDRELYNMTTASETTLSLTTDTSHVGSKRKYLESESLSTCSSETFLRVCDSKRMLHQKCRTSSMAVPTVAGVIVRKVLNKVRKARNISSLRTLMSLPKGRARRSKHDDITASVVDLSGFVS